MTLGRKLITFLSHIVRWLQNLKVNMLPRQFIHNSGLIWSTSMLPRRMAMGTFWTLNIEKLQKSGVENNTTK